jgi:hypothetical protein
MLPELSGYSASVGHNGAVRHVWEQFYTKIRNECLSVQASARACTETTYQFSDCQTSDPEVTEAASRTLAPGRGHSKSSAFCASDVNILLMKFQIYLVMLSVPWLRLKGRFELLRARTLYLLKDLCLIWIWNMVSCHATSTHRRTFSARPRVGMCRQCARPRARNVRHSGRVRVTMRLMSVFLFRIKGRSCPNTRKHERPDYWSWCVDGYIRRRMFGESFVVES